MRVKAILALPLLVVAGAALAQTALPEINDDDNSGNFSLSELQAVWPELTASGFSAIDQDVDGSVTEAELQTAIDNGVLTAPSN